MLQSKKSVATIYSKSRGSPVLNRHMGRYRGVVTSDKYPICKRSGPGGRHQPCRAHELRQLRYAAQKKNAPLSAGVLYLQVLDVYHAAPDADRPGTTAHGSAGSPGRGCASCCPGTGTPGDAP